MNDTEEIITDRVKYLCEVEGCSREFKKELFLMNHESFAHSGIFKCGLCKSSFGSQPSMLQHRVAVHEVIEKFKLKEHIRAKTKPKTEEAEAEPEKKVTVTTMVRCSHCSRSFASSNRLRQHVKDTHAILKKLKNETILKSTTIGSLIQRMEML